MTAEDRARLLALEKENARLRRQVEQAEAAVSIMGKAHELLQQSMQEPDPDDEVPPALMSVEEYQAWLARYRL